MTQLADGPAAKMVETWSLLRLSWHRVHCKEQDQILWNPERVLQIYGGWLERGFEAGKACDKIIDFLYENGT